MIDQYRTQIAALLPPPDTDARRDWLKAAMEVIADALVEHSDGNEESAVMGLATLAQQHGFDRILNKGL